MSKDPINKAADAAKHVVDDTRDALHEAGHRSEAEAEKARRKALGDEMTTGEKAGSAAHELKERAQADVAEAKRKLRDEASKDRA